MKLNTLLLSVQLLCVILQTVSSEVLWTHHTVLDDGGKYHLYWNPPEDKEGDSEIVFKVEVQAKGYVGFGLSPDGGMNGSDIVTGWVKDGKVFFQDRHGIGNKMPPKDIKQDWILMNASENKTHTILQIRRRLNTCDRKDMVIDESTMRVIYAFSDRDPDDENPTYHYKNRGWKSVMLLDSRSNTRPIPYEDSWLHWDVMQNNIDISDHDTLYWCQIFKSPSLSTKHHIVKAKLLIKEGNEQFTHHKILHECFGGTPEEYEAEMMTSGYACHSPNLPVAYRRCGGQTVGWSLGSEGPVFPEHVGVPFGPNPEKYYMLEVHYDNFQLIERVIDYSGLRIYYTPHLRKHDAGSFFTGSIISPRVIIPPGQEKFTVTGHSNPDCVDPVMPESGIRVFSIQHHTHSLGVGVRTRHFRGKKELPPIADDRNYDNKYQEYRYLNEEVSILPGDQITTECTYSSLGRTNVTLGGFSSRDEMCLSLVLYYPPIQRFMITSIPTISTINTALETNFTDDRSLYSLSDYNWDRVNIEELSKTLMNSRHVVECNFGNGVKDEVKSKVSYPKNFQPFVRIDRTCNKNGYNGRYMELKEETYYKNYQFRAYFF